MKKKRNNSLRGKVPQRSLTRWVHPLKKKMAAGQFVVGLTVSTPAVEIISQGAAQGFDFLWFEMEHAPLTLERIREMILATRSSPVVPLVRVPSVQRWLAKQVLDVGATGVIFPFTSSAGLAEEAARSCRYPPKGVRGSGSGLASFSWPEKGNYYDSADENVLTVCVVEDLGGLNEIEEICQVPGVDVIFIGTSDLSFALGARGNESHPKVQAAIGKIVQAARKYGKLLGRPVRTVSEIKQFRKEGFQFFQTISEIGFMNQAMRGFFQDLKKSASLQKKSIARSLY